MESQSLTASSPKSFFEPETIFPRARSFSDRVRMREDRADQRSLGGPSSLVAIGPSAVSVQSRRGSSAHRDCADLHDPPASSPCPRKSELAEKSSPVQKNSLGS